MLILKHTNDLVRLITSDAASIECHASWVDFNAGVVTPDGSPIANITTATTTTLVPAPTSPAVRNVKGIYLTNVHASVSCRVACEVYNGTIASEIFSFNLLPGEKALFDENGNWSHRDAAGAEYPRAGLGAYNGFPAPFMKSGTAADVAGCWYCTSKDNGAPGAWAPGTPGLNGRVTDGTNSTDNGCIPVKNPATGSNFLTGLNITGTVAHTHVIFDVLWVNSGIVVTTTTGQSITTPTLPARDIDGGTTGKGCVIGLLFVAAATNGAAIANATVTYTNSDGTGSRTATLAAISASQIPQSPVIGTIVWFNLQAGDTGVQSIESIALGTSLVTGTVSLLIARWVALLGAPVANVAATKQIGEPGIRLYDDSCLLHCYLASATTATFVTGELTVMEK